MNQIVITGNLGDDPKFHEQGFATFPLADTKKYKDKQGQQQEKTRWHDVTLGNTNQANYLRKGMKVTVAGELEYNVKGEGENKKKFTNVRAKFVEFMQGGNGGQQQNSGKNQQAQSSEKMEDEDDLPF